MARTLFLHCFGDEVKDLTVVIPAYKEDPKILYEIYQRLIFLGAEVIIVDDGNTMDLDVPSLTYPINMGYGYAIKYGVDRASNKTILTMDADGQHTVEDALKLYNVYQMIGDCKMIVGQRWNLKETHLRWFARKCLNFLASCIAGHYMVDLNSGIRIFDRDMAKGYKPILCDTFSFTTSFTMASVTDGHKIAYFPINVEERKHGKSRVKLFRDGLVTIYYIIWVGLALRTRSLRSWLRFHTR